MPRLSTLRLKALRDLIAELRYTPRVALLRCIERAESLALEIDAQTTYPMEWIVFRVTGYRPKSGPDAMILGGALVEDLSALLEHLCDIAGLREDELGADRFSIDDLAERWSVSRKTIERYRRQGLVARRYEAGAGVVRLSFSARVVEAFEEGRGERLERAGSFERIGRSEREWLYRRAVRYRLRLGWSFAKIAERLSERTGRSLAAVRRALLRADEQREAPLFRVRRKLPERQAKTIARAVDWGIRPGLIGERFGRSRASVLRIATDEHGARLRLALPDISPPGAGGGLDIASEQDEILATPGALEVDPPAPVLEAKALLADLSGGRGMEGEREAQAAAAHWLLLVRAGRAIEALPVSMASASAVDEIETDLRWALRLRRVLVQSQLPLVVRTLEDRIGGALLGARPDQIRLLVAAAMHATIGAVAAFHPVRPDRSLTVFGRLASPVSLALARSLSQADLERMRPSRSVGRAATARADLDDWTRWLAPWQGLVEAHPGVVRVLDKLSAEDAALVSAKYGLAAAPAQSNAAIAERLGVTPARVVSATRRARACARAEVERRG